MGRLQGITHKNSNQYFYDKAIKAIVESGYVPDGYTAQSTFRSGSADSPIYGGTGGEISTSGGRQRFAKTGTQMRATVGKITTCFYEVADGQTRNMVSVSTRDTKRITRWAATRICFLRRDAVALGREDEWLELNSWLFEDFTPKNEGTDMQSPTRSTQGGLEPRFIIERTDGKPIDPSRRYSLVLDFSGADPHAIVAAQAYANSIRAENPQLASDMEHAIANPADAPPQHKYA